MLKKLLIVFAVLLVVLIAAGFMVFQRFDGAYGIRQAPALSYMMFGGADADIVVRFEPDAARPIIQDIVAQQFPEATGWMNRLIANSLPHEMVLMASPRFTENMIDLTLFVNERRGGPVLAQQLTETALSGLGIEAVTWDPEGARLERRGAVVVDGTARLHADSLNEINRRWGDRSPGAPIVVEGGHLIEIIGANATGALYALVAAMTIPESGQADLAVVLALEEVKQIDTLRATADFISQDAMAIDIVIQCDPSIEADRPATLFLLLEEIVRPNLVQSLTDDYGLTLDGNFVRSAYEIRGAFTLNGFEALLQGNATTAEVAK